MNRRTSNWHSSYFEHDIRVACWGHWGQPVLLYPTAGGDGEECERFLMIRALEPLIEEGRIKVLKAEVSNRVIHTKYILDTYSLFKTKDKEAIREIAALGDEIYYMLTL